MADNYFIYESTINNAARSYNNNPAHRDANPAASNYIKLMKALCPDRNFPDTNNSGFSEIINDRIEEVLKNLIGGNTPILCLDTFIDWFGEGIKLNRQEEYDTIRKLIEGICQHKDEFRSNIERLYG